MTNALLDRHNDRISGRLSCYDRVMITGTLPTVCFADGMTKFLHARHIRIFDYPRFAEPLRDSVREQAKAGLLVSNPLVGKVGFFYAKVRKATRAGTATQA